ncbi:sugar kinase [Paracidovorax avenae]|uniref:ROK family protein n=1 Tax=Paracidovorax avenae TaxID=80867 RepID=UPI000D229017|nr:ROK family protein [Paracidovorax avenae]AVS79032.1 sugar kinase [Paracidovorax avenae]AVT08001.1 sugar kinase [Paracidovorax avenae]
MRACIDIGGTKVAVALAPAGTDRAALVARRSEPTVKEGPPDALARQCLRMVDEACAEAGISRAQLQSTGVASCGPFVLQDGMVEVSTPNICGGLPGADRSLLPNDWTRIPLQAPLAEALGRVNVQNDAVAALVAERRWGALQGLDHCAYVTWSTGVGVGLCVDGIVLRGKNGNAGHAGHSFSSDGPPDAACGCGNVGDVESLVAGNAIPRRWGRDAGGLIGAAREGDAAASEAVAQMCRVLGRMLYNLVAILDLQRISIGGSVFLHHQDFLLPRLQAEVSGHLPALTGGVLVVPAGLGLQIGDYAALAMAG